MIVVVEVKLVVKVKVVYVVLVVEQFIGVFVIYMLGVVLLLGVNVCLWVFVDVMSNMVFVLGNVDECVELVLLMKLMIVYFVFEVFDKKKILMEQIVMLSDVVCCVGCDELCMFIEVNKLVFVYDFVYGMIIQLGNDVVIVLVEFVGGSEGQFVMLMNDEVVCFGMKGMYFVDVNGMFDLNYYMMVGDFVKLFVYLICDFLQYYGIFLEKEFKYNNICQGNCNWLLWFDLMVDGLKMGYMQVVGFCLIVLVKCVILGVDGQCCFVLVMMGEQKENDCMQDSMKMLNYGYSVFDLVCLFKGGQVILMLCIYKGKDNIVQVGVKGDQWVIVLCGFGDKVKIEVDVNVLLIVLFVEGQQVGIVKIVVDGKMLFEFLVVVLQVVLEVGIFGCIWDLILLMFSKKK